MRVEAAEHARIEAESLSSLRVWSETKSTLELPERIQTLSLGAEIQSFGGTKSVEALSLDEGSDVYATDLESLGALTLRQSRLEAPSLLQMDSAVLHQGALVALHLERLSSLEVYQSELFLPLLYELDSLEGQDTDLPTLRAVSELDFDGTLSALTEVRSSLRGAPFLPALEVLEGAARITTRQTSLPSLRHSGAALKIEGSAWLPALRRVEGSLVLIDTPLLYAPELQTVDWITLQGDSTPPLPDPMPWGLRLVDWEPSTPYTLGVLQGGLVLSDRGEMPPALEVSEAQGNVVINAPDWTSVQLTLGPISGDLSYCLASLAEGVLQAWLAEQVVDGEIMETCG